MAKILTTCIMLALTCAAAAQQVPQPVPTPHALLNRAYTLSTGLPMEIRYHLLRELVKAAVKKDVAEGRQWSDELFTMSQQLPPGPGRESAQSMAIWAMSRWDADRAVNMTCELDVPTASELAVFTTRRSEAIRGVFQAALAKGGEQRITQVQECAQRLGDRGQYPYTAALPSLSFSSPEQQQAIFDQALSYYRRSAPSPGNDLDFLTFLQGSAKRVPPDVAARAAGEMAIRLQRYAESDPPSTSELRVSTDKGVAVLDNPGDRIIWEALPVLRSIDAKVADKVRASRPALNVATLLNAQVRSQTPYGRSPNAGESQARSRGDATRWLRDDARANPPQAEQLTATVTDPVARASTLAELAVSTYKQDPARAQKLLKEARGEVEKIEKLTSRIWAVTRVAEAAEKLENIEMVKDAINQGFAWTQRFVDAARERPIQSNWLLITNGYGALFLAEVGARVAPQLTVERIDTLREPATEAFLLTIVAQDLRTK